MRLDILTDLIIPVTIDPLSLLFRLFLSTKEAKDREITPSIHRLEAGGPVNQISGDVMNQHTTVKHRTAQILFVIAAFSVTANAEAACRKIDFVCKALAEIKSIGTKTIDSVENILDDKEETNAMRTEVAKIIRGTYAYPPNKAVIDNAVLAVRGMSQSQKDALRAAAIAQLVKAEKFNNALKNLDKDGKSAVRRIQRYALAIVAEGADSTNRQAFLTNAAKDLELVANKLALKIGQANVPNNVTNSSIGVFVTASASFVGGLGGAVGIVMDLAPQNGKLGVGCFISLGASAGLDFGLAAAAGISWAPNTVAETAGGYVGTGVQAEALYGAGIGVGWSVEKGMSGIERAIPGVSGQVGVGVKLVVLSLEGGYTFAWAIANI
jgi:hypothetical protein